MDIFKNRHEAGKVLADMLSAYANNEEVIVLALPRGGVPVGFEIASALNAPLDVYVVRKLGVPGHSELAFGAIAPDNVQVFNEDIMRHVHLDPSEREAVINKEQQELIRRIETYRGKRSPLQLKHKTVILVDDGIATGATMRVAIQALKKSELKALVVAVPVAEQEIARELSSLVDHFVCPLLPVELNAVGSWYEDFSQTEDAEVHACLKAAPHAI